MKKVALTLLLICPVAVAMYEGNSKESAKEPLANGGVQFKTVRPMSIDEEKSRRIEANRKRIAFLKRKLDGLDEDEAEIRRLEGSERALATIREHRARMRLELRTAEDELDRRQVPR